MNALTATLFIVLVLGVAMGRSSRRARPAAYRPSWIATPEQRELANRLEKAAAHYRAGRPGRAEGLLANPLISWDVIAQSAAHSGDLLAQRIAALLRAEGGERRFIHELGHSHVSDQLAALTSLIAALRGPVVPARDRAL